MSTMPATEADKNQLPLVQQIVSIMWPSFLTASAATIIFFTLFDPIELGQIGGFPSLTRTGGYTIGFFCFWLLTSISCALTCYFRRPTNRFNTTNKTTES
ncbi:MAG: hypothetical protein KDJ39_14030 [Gammaproteobacteria bacterium]|nr:hypothetical protein [Gammaproteobacteria bacterium]MCP5299261.1 hypothetical protein [Chromatiaceae bacterium]